MIEVAALNPSVRPEFSLVMEWPSFEALRVEERAASELVKELRHGGVLSTTAATVLSSQDQSVVTTGSETDAKKVLDGVAGQTPFEDVDGAFLVFDWKHHRLVARTDRLGTAPVYYLSDEQRVVVGSSPERLLTSLDDMTPSEQSLYNYVYFHVVPAPRTALGNLRKLMASEQVVLTQQGARATRYWTPRFSSRRQGATEDSYPNRDEMYRRLRKTLKEAVARKIPSEGRVGAFLSGGLDSSTVAGMLSELRDDASAFAIGFEAEGYDEMPFARISAQHFGIELNELYVKPDDVVQALPELAASFDEPFGNSSALPAYFCARMAAKNNVELLLAGDGGDELFAGNERYKKQTVFERYRALPEFLRRKLIEPLTAVLPENSRLAKKGASFLKQANIDLPERLWSYSFLEQTAPTDVFCEEFLRSVDCEDVRRTLRATYERTIGQPVTDRMLHLDWQITLADNDLRKVNQACALAGVRVEYPMLDARMLDFSLELPSEWKLEGGELRSFYRRAMRGWLPDATLDKSKHGFGLPFGVWMRDHKPLRELAYHNIKMLSERGIFQKRFLKHAIEKHETGHAAYFGEMIWVLCALELWLAAHVDDYGREGF